MSFSGDNERFVLAEHHFFMILVLIPDAVGI